MSRIVLGVICGLVFGAVDVGIMLPMTFADKRAAITAAFIARFAIGFVIGAARLPWPGWLVGLFFGAAAEHPRRDHYKSVWTDHRHGSHWRNHHRFNYRPIRALASLTPWSRYRYQTAWVCSSRHFAATSFWRCSTLNPQNEFSRTLLRSKEIRVVSRLLWPHSYQQRQFPPLPVTIHIGEPNLAQPAELRLEIQQLVGRILGLYRESDALQKFLMQTRRRATTHAPGCRTRLRNSAARKSPRRAPASVRAPGDEWRNWRSPHQTGPSVGSEESILWLDHAHARIPGKPFSRGVQHGRREIDRHRFSVGMSAAHQRQQVAHPRYLDRGSAACPAGMNSSSAASPSPRCEIKSARSR